MRTVREVAEMFHVSYEAVRKQIKRYKNELEGHIFKQGRTQLLDDEAIAFLREHRESNPIIVGQSEKAAQFEQQKEQITVLLAKVAEQADKIAAQSEELRQFDKLQLESGEKIRQAEGRAAEAERRSEQAEAELQQLRAELEAEKSRKLTWRERFRGRK